MGRFEGTRVAITGGNSGIGLATAKAFASEGARVAIFGRSAETLEVARRDLGGDTLAIQGDVARLEDLDRFFAAVEEAFGGLDVVFVNAGIAPFAPLEAVTEASFDSLLGVNLKGAFFTIQKAVRLLNGGGSVILTGSVLDRKGMPGAAVYAASKAAIRSLARTLTAELAPRGIRVNTLSPGPIETPIYGRLGLSDEEVEEMGTQIASQVPLGRFGRAEETAEAVLFLASPGGAFVAGSDLAVDGGFAQV